MSKIVKSVRIVKSVQGLPQIFKNCLIKTVKIVKKFQKLLKEQKLNGTKL